MPVRKIAAHGSYRRKQKTFRVPEHVTLQFLTDHGVPLDNMIARFMENKDVSAGVDQYLSKLRYNAPDYGFPDPHTHGDEVQNYDIESVLGDLANRPKYNQGERDRGVWWTPAEGTKTTLMAWVQANAHLGTAQDPLFVLCLFCRDEAEVNVSGRKCYLTTATCESLGLGDGCRDLAVLRRYRDQVLLKTHEGREAVALYYDTAPRIVAALDAREDCNALYRRIHRQWITPAVDRIVRGENARAFRTYREMVRVLRRLVAAPRG